MMHQATKSPQHGPVPNSLAQSAEKLGEIPAVASSGGTQGAAQVLKGLQHDAQGGNQGAVRTSTTNYLLHR